MRYGSTSGWRGPVAHPTKIYKQGAGPYSGITRWVALCGQTVKDTEHLQPDRTRICSKCMTVAQTQFVKDVEEYIQDCTAEEQIVLEAAILKIKANELEFEEWWMSPKDYLNEKGYINELV